MNGQPEPFHILEQKYGLLAASFAKMQRDIKSETERLQKVLKEVQNTHKNADHLISEARNEPTSTGVGDIVITIAPPPYHTYPYQNYASGPYKGHVNT